MAQVLVRTTIPGMDSSTYDQIAEGLIPELRKQPGFVLHVAFSTPDGFSVSEIWETREQQDAWFSKHVQPHLPPGAIKHQYLDVHALVSPE